MSVCHGCLRVFIKNLALLAQPRLHSRTQLATRGFHTTARTCEFNITRYEHGRTLKEQSVPPLAPEDHPDAPPSWGTVVGKQRREEVGAALKQRRPPREFNSSALKTELQFLKDPLKLAEHIKYLLDNDDVDKAQALVRLSTKAFANTVSWNHVIDWQMRRGKTNAAMDTYNEMKKRGQSPDSRTFTILLRGLANYAQHTGSLGRALSLYHAMSAPHSKVAPNIIHVNAVLKVCTRANDMDSMWDILSKLPAKGPHAADAWTFTTIFHHMHYDAVTSPNVAEDGKAAKLEETIVRARQLWNVVVERWRAADIRIDEPLMASMGRLLLIGGRPRDWDDILSLVEQTTRIPRLVPRLGSNEIAKIEAKPGLIGPKGPGHMEGSEFDPITKTGEEKAVAVQKKGAKTSAAFVEPSRATLGLLLDACGKLYNKTAARSYWDLLTDPEAYNIKPDLANIHSMLRLLRTFRSSTDATKLVCDDLSHWGIKGIPMTYNLALRACVRDKLNPQALESAWRVLDAMRHEIPGIDMAALDQYVHLVAIATDRDALLRAADRLDPVVTDLRSFLLHGPALSNPNEPPERQRGIDKKKFTPKYSQADRELAMQFLQRVISCYDKILLPTSQATVGWAPSTTERPPPLPKQARQLLMERKTKLAAFITRYRNKWIERQTGRTDWRPEDKGQPRKEAEGDLGSMSA